MQPVIDNNAGGVSLGLVHEGAQEERRERFLSKVRPEWHLPHFMH